MAIVANELCVRLQRGEEFGWLRSTKHDPIYEEQGLCPCVKYRYFEF